MKIFVRLKNDEEIVINVLNEYCKGQTIEFLKDRITSVLSNNSNHIHFQNDTFDRDLIVMKDFIKCIEFK